MKIHLSNSVWIGNIDPFIHSFDTGNDKVLEITSHKKWVSVHPVVLCMIIGLGLFILVAIVLIAVFVKEFFDFRGSLRGLY